MSKIEVFYQSTPNPDSLKFMISTQIASTSMNFASEAEAGKSPLARKILAFPWAAGVFIGPNFVTVTKQNWVEWEILADPLSDLIQEFLTSGQPVIVEATPVNDNSEEDSPTVREIKRILREEIAPAVAMDGGEITFHKYENGRVYLMMHGACSGCPSSTFTLKEGIESRLKASLPEIEEVVQV